MTPYGRRLLKKWDAQILTEQFKDRIDGKRISKPIEYALYFERQEQGRRADRRNQALRASGQIAEAQRNDGDRIRLQRPRDWQDLCADIEFRAAQKETWRQIISPGPQVFIAERMAKRLQEVRAKFKSGYFDSWEA